MTTKYTILFALTFLSSLFAFSQTVEFIENRGQWDNRVKYMGRVSAGAFFVQQDGFTVLQHNPKDWAQLTQSLHRHAHDSGAVASRKMPENITVKSHAYRVNFLGGASSPQVVADKPLATYNNYFIGNDPSKWASHCKIFQGITVKDVYPNIDVRYYSGQGAVKYDLIVHPGGNPSDIALKYEGADGLEVKNKELRIQTSVGELRELNPYSYQYNEAGKITRNAKYSVKNNVVRFDIKDYDPKATLVIDPDLIFCSFSGSTADNWGFSATYGPDGSMFGGGIVFSSGFPVSTGAFQTTFSGGTAGTDFRFGFDIGLIKLTPDGKNRVFATYLGGDGNEMPQSLVVNDRSELIVAGRTSSTNFPTTGVGKFGSCKGFDIFVTKFTADGSGLIGSKKVGGDGSDGANISDYGGSGANSILRNYGDEARSEVNLDPAGNIYLSSCTQSTSGPDSTLFPTVNAAQNKPAGNQDGVVLKFDPSVSNLLFSTFLGGSGDDAAYVVSVNPTDGNVYVAGGTESVSTNPSDQMPGPKGGTLGATPFGSIDGFVSIFSPTGALLKTTYVGTRSASSNIPIYSEIYGLKFDNNGFPYVMGQTTGKWPVINAAWSQTNGKQFIAKLKPDLSAFIYSTSFGKGQAVPDISPVAFLVDRCENVYISGWGGRISSFPNAGVLGLPVTPDALKSKPDPGPSGSGEDFYFFVLKKDAASQLYGSFFGQNNGAFPDHVDGGTSRFDSKGVIYQAICASCETNNPFPTDPPDVWAYTKPPTAGCNLAMVKIAFNFAGTAGHVRAAVNGVPRDTAGCVPLTVDFTDTIQEAPLYEWNFGDGTPGFYSTKPDTSHTFTAIGDYQVMLVAVDSSKCFPRDTSYVIIRVGNNRATPQFTPVKLSPPCDAFRYRFDNTTVAPPSIPFRSQSFTWDFGDGSAKVVAGSNSVFHTYAAAGTYVVKLTLNDTSYCNSPETYIDTLRVAATVKAVLVTPSTGCAPYDAVFKNESVGGSTFIFDFGDGSTATSPPASPTHTYANPGTYTVTMTAIDSNTCNVVDKTSVTITVYGAPTADFTASPQPPQVNVPISYTNLSSSDAVRFKWVWGDGDSLLTTSRSVVQHEFNLTGTYNTCLTAYNAAGCPAQQCRTVSATTEPAVDVPNAFTPQSGDVNSKVFVRGFGIAKLNFAIYARWGEKVFETADKRIGWDGRYKGQLLPMDAYAYTLDVEFADGKKYHKTGDITLIR